MDATKENVKTEAKQKSFNIKKYVRTAAVVVCAVFLGYIHYHYVATLFENDRNFSFLSELEREMSFRTEMGFYYSYYKTIVEERPFIQGVSKLMYDRLVEYPKDVNAFNRFNIHPEVIIGALYRYLEPWLNTTSYRQCHMVDRGEDLKPVQSCVGIGQPIFFYLEAIWWLAGLMVAAIFLSATALSESVVGGVLAVAQYFANHAECTRVQWAPNERENAAAPLLVLQAWLVSAQLRRRAVSAAVQLQVSIVIINCLCLLFWQFTQFIFLTQTAIFFIMEQLRIIDLKTLCIFLHSHFCGLHMAVILLQGNDMLKSSLYTSFFIVISVYCLFFNSLRIKVENRLDLFVECWLVLIRVCLVVFTSFYVKKIITDFLEVEEDRHIWDILLSKFTNFKNFHTLLYTCSEVFDFMPISSIINMISTLLIPIVFLNVINVFGYWLYNARNYCENETENTVENESEKEKDSSNQDDADDSGIENSSESKIKNCKNLDTIDAVLKSKKENGVKEKDEFYSFFKNLQMDPALFYNLLQMAVYGIMAGLVMRLKLLFSTQMCIVSSLIVNVNYYMFPKSIMKYIPIFWIICAAVMAPRLYQNIKQELSHIGEFSDIHQEELLEWILKETSPSDAFAGSMPVLATVMLTTRRPIVAHPHYEHYEARRRAYTVYKMYGKFSPLELYQELTKLRVTYLIVENKYCYGRSSKNCSFENIWDIEVPTLAHQPLLCHTLLTETVDHLYPVFRNNHYAVLRIHDYSVRYMPRSFDT